jgi:hypothetical protein
MGFQYRSLVGAVAVGSGVDLAEHPSNLVGANENAVSTLGFRRSVHFAPPAIAALSPPNQATAMETAPEIWSVEDAESCQLPGPSAVMSV